MSLQTIVHHPEPEYHAPHPPEPDYHAPAPVVHTIDPAHHHVHGYAPPKHGGSLEEVFHLNSKYNTPLPHHVPAEPPHLYVTPKPVVHPKPEPYHPPPPKKPDYHVRDLVNER